MTIRTARNGDVEIAYETLGSQSGEPLLLVMGIGGHMLSWPDEFCRLLVDRGFWVTRFDNRDAGLSTRFTEAGAPSQVRMVFLPASAALYSLEDMADDAVAVLDAQGWSAAHIVGVSLGGQIAQTMAVRHPDRVRTLTSISSSPAPRIGQPTPITFLRLLIGARLGKRVKTQAHTDAFVAGLTSLTGSGGHTADEDQGATRGQARAIDDHGGLDMAAFQRQTAAIAASGDRRPALAHVQIPTLVLHGEDDQMVRPIAGKVTADAIPGARLVMYPGMGHDLPPKLWAAMIDEIASMVERSATYGPGRTRPSAD